MDGGNGDDTYEVDAVGDVVAELLDTAPVGINTVFAGPTTTSASASRT